VLRNTTLVPSLGLRIGPACEAVISTGMWKEHVAPQKRKKERKRSSAVNKINLTSLKSYTENEKNQIYDSPEASPKSSLRHIHCGKWSV